MHVHLQAARLYERLGLDDEARRENETARLLGPRGDAPLPTFGDNEEVQKSWARIKQGLNDALGLDLATTKYQLGRLLEFDAESEQFIGDAAANKLLTREYRDPYVVPEKV